MKTLKLLIVLLIPGMLLAGSPPADFTKEISKTFDVNSDALLEVDNKYGDIEISTWDKDVIQIDVVIKVDHKNAEKAQKKLDEINVEFSASSDRVSAFTKVCDDCKTGASSGYNNLEIDYTIKMPLQAALDISNKFGNVVLPIVNGETRLRVSYGSLHAAGLMSKVNDVEVNYGKGYISDSEYLNLKLRYTSPFEVKRSRLLDLDTQYGETRVGAVGRLLLKAQYDELDIIAAAELIGDVQYSDVEVTSITKKLVMDIQYGGLEVEKIANSMTEVRIETAYSGIELGVQRGANFDFHCLVRYAGLDYPSNFNLSKNAKTTSAEYRGSVGSGGAVFEIESAYGGVEIDWVE